MQMLRSNPYRMMTESSIVEQATNGGKACEGQSIETALCKLNDCFGMYNRMSTMKPK